MSKAFGRDINNFWNTSFPEGYIIEDDADWIEDYTQADLLNLPEAEKFELSEFGFLLNEDTGAEHSFASAFKRWQKKQTVVTIAIEVKTENREGAILRLKEMGFKVVK